MGSAPFNVEGPMARTVEDLAFYLSAIVQPEARVHFSQPLEQSFQGVRVAWWRGLGGVPFDAEVREMTNAQRRVFESMGCIVEEAEPDFTGVDETFRTLRFHSTSLRLGEHAKRHPGLVKETILWEIEQSKRLTERDVAEATLRYAGLQTRMQEFLTRYEFFVLPVSQVAPFSVTQPWPVEIDGTKMDTYIDWIKSCYYISVMGTPAISVPCGFTREGLPIGLQITGRHRADWGVLQIARAFEQALSPKP